VPLDEVFTIRVEDYAMANGGIIFPNPNAPTGCLLPLAAIERLLPAHRQSVVVVDEAYVDFGGDRRLPWSTAIQTCWWCTPFPSRVRWPDCGLAMRWARTI
jgi:histidinol-phosphate/aromatic aminotransferase/cobyric acid decarboxylase-like protein